MSSAQLGAFVEKFRALTLERLVRLNQLFMQWRDNPQDTTCLRDMQRELHNLKGEAKLMNFNHVAEVVHRIEDHVAQAPPPGQQLRSDVDSRILAGFDLLGAMVTQDPGDDLTGRTRAYVGQTDSGEPVSQSSPWSEDTGRLALRSAHVQNRRSRRVDMQKLDAVADITGDLLLTQGRLAQSIKKLHGLVSKEEQSNVNAYLEQVRRWLGQQQNDIEKLEATVRDLRLVPLRTLVDTFERTVQDLAYEQHKQVRLTQDNTGVGIDSDVLERLSDPLLQLLVNGVVHGIETPAARTAQGKTPHGTLRVAVRPGASVVDIDVADDGAGVQRSRVAEVAVQQRLVDGDATRQFSEDTVFEMIFQPGFTTRQNISDRAGRGVGLDAVRAQVTALGGTVNVRSIEGVGTTFTISVPTTMLWVRALLVRWDQQYFAIPADTITKVVRLDDAGAEKSMLRVQGNTVAMAGLGSMLGLAQAGEAARVAIVVRHEHNSGALQVHQVMGERQVVQRRLDPASAHMPFHSGTVTLENGARAGLLNITQLLDEMRHVRPVLPREYHVLVADDSDLVREKVTQMLRSAGFRVTSANDGLAALRLIERERPDAVVSDLEMPHLDGLGLLAAVRRQADMQQLPFVIVSAKDSEDLRTQARALRVSGYLNKAELQDAALTDLIRRLVNGPLEGA